MMLILLLLVGSLLLINVLVTVWKKPRAKTEPRSRTRASPWTSIRIIQIVITVVVILILAAMLQQPLGVVREDARRSLCESNLRQVWQALALYAGQNNGRY